eukprot:CAMPEP_0201491440 /NCGR_PEP_ID=MMETSP0151_2-20130828/29813_1 /ASSEMBLY_ACC=CAM_ASM_000257 /TAXON_ID=200890 /ORGANISM="Paramoeba atlantica, Strain 621/1 / CCAP 1560/9" /LENGTH=190 /DNA_ID=CAMNT_0047877795 /DNA_START=151 /DNA_END=720 /DNA_ORIENTATION=-
MPDYPQKKFSWMGYDWMLRYAYDYQPPGPNLWGRTDRNAWVDESGFLNLRIYPLPATNFWVATEVLMIPTRPFEYGTFEWKTSTRLDSLEDHLVASFSLNQGIDLKPNTTELSNSPIQQAAITWTRSTFSEKKYCSFSVLPKDSKNRTNYRWQNFPMGGTSRTRQVTHQIRWSEEGITFYLEFGGEKRSW